MENNQFKYIVKTLSRTKRKDYENYCVNRIWTLLNRTDIKPVTQSYVQFNNGNYALLDLHFPSLNYAIEIDEPHHKKQSNEDINRSEKIKEQFMTYRHEDLIIRRIDISKGLNDVNQKINEIVSELETIIEHSNYDNIKWHDLSEDELLDYLKQQRVISVNDDIHFKHMVKACELFEVYYKGPIQNGYTILKSNPEYTLWFPKEVEYKNGQPVLEGKWINIYDENNQMITEYSTGSNEIKDVYGGKKRLTFLKVKDPITGKFEYQFVGVFEILKDDLDNNQRKRYVRISDYFNLKEVNPYF